MTKLLHWARDDHLYSDEVELYGLTRNFAERGDSGSVVMNESGKLLGLPIGDDCCSSDRGYEYVTPIRDIQEDIELQTGGVLGPE